MRRALFFFQILSLFLGASCLAAESSDLKRFEALLKGDPRGKEKAIRELSENWKSTYIAPTIEVLQYSSDRSVLKLLQEKTGKRLAVRDDEWFHWLWSQPEEKGDFYSDFKVSLYSYMDPRFAEYFSGKPETLIRLDEVRWGGVKRDGIPPLKNPKMLRAEDADYLQDDNIVFGISINGDARAYPKRILAWHEMFKDTIGGKSINGVYCTLCGSMIVYDTKFDGKHYELGTSGFLYRSNKLMYDHATKSMWSTLEGKPVIGKLANKGIQLKPLHVVTTTWGQWRKQHPQTKVLSLDTGHRRDYGEGVAYRDYFATDRLMFTVPETDGRLKNKDEVFVLRFTGLTGQPLAIAARYLAKRPIYQSQHEGKHFVILTDDAGANRVYAAPSGGVSFKKFNDDVLTAGNGEKWNVNEARIKSPEGKEFERLPAHRAFWFGWYSSHPETLLIK